MIDTALINELRSGLLLSKLSEEQLERVAAHAFRTTLEGGQLLFTQGESATRFYLVMSGQMRLFRLSPDGAEKVIEIVGPGQTFAEAIMFFDSPLYPVCAAALGSTEVIAIDAPDFTRMLRESVDTCLVLLGVLSQRLRGLIREIDNLTLHTAAGRVARYLLTRLPPDQNSLDLPVRKGVLASRLSIKPETFSRVEKDLIGRGIIEVQGSHVSVLDRQALEDIGKLDASMELTPMACAPGTKKLQNR